MSDMYSSLADVLFHDNICVLPGLGVLGIEATSASTDFINSQIKGPGQHIFFRESDHESDRENEFSKISQSVLADLNEKKTVDINGIGTFFKDDNGHIQFTPFSLDILSYQPVPAYRVIRENAEHSMLVGDRETTSSVMADFFSVEQKITNKWWVWAAAIAVISIAVIVINFYSNGFDLSNKKSLQLTPAETFHKTIK